VRPRSTAHAGNPCREAADGARFGSRAPALAAKRRRTTAVGAAHGQRRRFPPPSKGPKECLNASGVFRGKRLSVAEEEPPRKTFRPLPLSPKQTPCWPHIAAHSQDRNKQPRMNTDDTDLSNPDARASRLPMRSAAPLLRRWLSNRPTGTLPISPEAGRTTKSESLRLRKVYSVGSLGTDSLARNQRCVFVLDACSDSGLRSMLAQQITDPFFPSFLCCLLYSCLCPET